MRERHRPRLAGERHHDRTFGGGSAGPLGGESAFQSRKQPLFFLLVMSSQGGRQGVGIPNGRSNMSKGLSN